MAKNLVSVTKYNKPGFKELHLVNGCSFADWKLCLVNTETKQVLEQSRKFFRSGNGFYPCCDFKMVSFGYLHARETLIS